MNRKFLMFIFSSILLIMILLFFIYKISNKEGTIRVNVFSPFIVDIIK